MRPGCSRRRTPARRRLLASATLLGALGLPLGAVGGCSGDQGDSSSGEADADGSGEATPEEVLALAKTTLDETSGVAFALSTTDLPDGVNGLTGADGVLTSAPAFEGTLSVTLLGNSVEVPVVGVDQTTYAEVPLTPGFQEVDPGDYGAPDPAGLIDPDDGVSSLLPATTGVEQGDTVRGGADNTEVLTELTGTVAASTMVNLIPSAEGDFDVSYAIAENGELRQATLTGIFYPDSASMTYTVDLTEYGTTQDIVAP